LKGAKANYQETFQDFINIVIYAYMYSE